MITQAELKKLLHYNPNTGIFTWLIPNQRANVGNVVGNLTNGYLRIYLKNKGYACHRLAWLYVYGEFPKNHIDHINGITTDNRIINLRDVDRFTNQQNRRKSTKNNKSQYLGVSKKRNKWRARINIEKKEINLGVFDTPELAYKAYLNAKRIMHKGCTI